MLAPWLSVLSRLTSLDLGRGWGLASEGVPTLAALPSLGELQLERWEGGTWGRGYVDQWGDHLRDEEVEWEGGGWGDEEEAAAAPAAAPAAAAVCAGVTKLVCGIVVARHLESLAAAFPAVAEAELSIVGCRSGGEEGALPASAAAAPAAAWPGLRSLSLYNEYPGAAPMEMLRRLCADGGALRLRRLTLAFEFVGFCDADLSDLLAAAPELECLFLGSGAALTDGAFGSCGRHERLRRLHICIYGHQPCPLPLSPAGLLSLGRALPRLESLCLGGGEEAGAAAAAALDRACGGDGACALPTDRERAAREEALRADKYAYLEGPTFEGRPWGGPLLRAIRAGLARQRSAAPGGG